MFTRRIFDGVVITILLFNGAAGVVKMAARRWSREAAGVLAEAGDVVQVLAR